MISTTINIKLAFIFTEYYGSREESVYGTVSLNYIEGQPYIPYDNLTQIQVINWVETALGVEQVSLLKSNIATQIQNKIAPPVITPPLPWSISYKLP